MTQHSALTLLVDDHVRKSIWSIDMSCVNYPNGTVWTKTTNVATKVFTGTAGVQ